jgi:hypothetical protein
MKKMKLYFAIAFMTVCGILTAQEAKKVIHQAMEQEISRNIQNLHLTGMKDPFYIGLDIVDFNTLAINSSLGALIRISESPTRAAVNNLVLVGDYNNNNLNYSDPRSSSYFLRTLTTLTLDNSLPEIQKKLWLAFDKAYKLSAELYESKQSALKSKAQEEGVTGIPDFLKGEKTLVEKPEISLKYDNETLIKYANEISLALKSFKFLTNSWVRLVGCKANIYYSNSEGSKSTYPESVMRLVINIETQTPSGELLELYQMYHSLNETDLPARDKVIKDEQAMAEFMAELINAPVFDDVYSGPVLFEDQAASETVRKTMFFARNENLFSFRKPITGGTTNMPASQNRISTDDRIDKKIAHEGLNVKAKPAMSEYNGIALIGSYPIDMEGTIAPKEVILIENGVLKNLLSGRTPTAKTKASNGHLRVPLNYPNPMIVPGVIEVDFTNGISKEELKNKLIETAKNNGLDYALIVREMTPNQSELRKVYKVDVKTGNEKLVRSASFSGLTLNDLRKIIGASNHKIVLNTTAGEDLQHKFDYLSGCPATFITPDAFLFRDIEVNKSTRPIMNKLPIVKNPLDL